jgi:D-xylose 1-dehydrogenase (NADP+, D-xylono-1,5-lactone-forming)
MKATRWGMLSTSSIGKIAAAALAETPEAELVAIAGRDGERARVYAEDIGVATSYGSYDELLAAEDVDAVYIPLPIALHTEWTIRALEAGKHVLCEKPFAVTAADAARAFDVAEARDLMCIEGLMYRHHPQTLLAHALLKEGAIGQLAHIRAALTVSAPAGDIRRTTALGGGASLDLGCYCVSAIRLFAGEPTRVFASRVLDSAPGAEGADLRLSAIMDLPDQVSAQFDVALDFPRRDELEIIGTIGKISIPDPWLCRSGQIELERNGHTEIVNVDPDNQFALTYADNPDNADAYRLEFVAATRAIRGVEQPRVGRHDAIVQAAALAAIRRSAEIGHPVALPVPVSPHTPS